MGKDEAVFFAESVWGAIRKMAAWFFARQGKAPPGYFFGAAGWGLWGG
jgi:hypothetical protein